MGDNYLLNSVYYSNSKIQIYGFPDALNARSLLEVHVREQLLCVTRQTKASLWL